LRKLEIIILLSSVCACAKTPEGQNPSTCGDGEDNDFNGRVDCEDDGCAQFPECIRLRDEALALEAAAERALEAEQPTKLLVRGLDLSFDLDGLTVETEENGKDVNWSEAEAYCNDLNLLGQTDWRLPDVNEAVKILKSGLLNRENSYVMWTSTKNNIGKAVVVGMSGAVNELGIRSREECRARCVRGTTVK
jgi:hypothetical protein